MDADQDPLTQHPLRLALVTGMSGAGRSTVAWSGSASSAYWIAELPERVAARESSSR